MSVLANKLHTLAQEAQENERTHRAVIDDLSNRLMEVAKVPTKDAILADPRVQELIEAMEHLLSRWPSFCSNCSQMRSRYNRSEQRDDDYAEKHARAALAAMRGSSELKAGKKAQGSRRRAKH